MDFKYIEVVFGRIKKKIEELEKTIIIILWFLLIGREKKSCYAAEWRNV